MKKEFVFVILHYNEKSLKDTFECIESIQKIAKNENYQIIIVENGSKDKSEEILIKKYENNKVIDIVISKENLGFAKGNNLGCKVGIKKYLPEILIVLNNDTYIKQNDFLKKIREIYKKEQFHLLGPYIFDKNLKPQNPQLNLLIDVDKIEKELEKAKQILIKLETRNKICIFIENMKQIIKKSNILERLIRKLLKKENVSSKYANQILRNVGLHGSCLIFSKKYYEKYEDIFYSKTFMYGEEDILYYRVLKDNLISIYSPELKIFHKEDSSTDAILKNNNEKKQFILKNRIKSLEIYRNLLRNEKMESDGL